MAEHNLFLGGDCPATVDQRRAMLPSTEVARDFIPFEPAAHKGGIHRFALNRRLDFLGCKTIKEKRPFHGKDAEPPKPVWNFGEQDFGSQALEQYLRDNTIAVDDILNIIALPNHCIIDRVIVEVCRPVDGVTFDLEIRNGTVEEPEPIPVLAGIDAADPELCELIQLPEPYFTGKHNDMLRLVVTGLPDDPAKLCELCIEITVMLDWTCSGFY